MKSRLLLVMGALLLVGCSTTQFDAGFKNLTSAQCADQQGTLGNLPMAFITPAQAAEILKTVCAALYGSAAAPTTAVGQAPIVK